MGGAAGEGDALDGCVADEAGEVGALVDLMAELEEAADAVGVDVVGDGGAAELDGLAQDSDQRCAQPGELGARKARGLAARADAGEEDCLVGVDVADAVEERLVEQRGLDGGAAVAEEGDEVFEGNGEGLAAGALVRCPCHVVRCSFGRVEGEAAEAAGVDEADFALIVEGEDGMGVGWDGGVRGRDEEAAGHAEMDEEFG